jgi:hypothetical protein
MPMVVFVHAGDETFMRNRPQNIDLVGIRNTLEASRYEVREWVAGRDTRPAPQPGQPAVWVIVPPPVPERRSVVAGESELALLGATRDLLADGEPVLLNVAPSLASRLGRDDPWTDLLDALGLESDISRVLVERTRDGAGNTVIQRVFQVVDYEPGHPVAAATHGLRTTFDLPVVLELPAEPRPGFTATVIAAAQPSPERWIEAEWMLDPQTLPGPAPETRLTEPAPLVVAVEKGHPIEPGARQRAMVVGSGGWLLSYVADLVLGAGGDRAVLLNPGNYELLLASVAWLAGADDLIAAGPVSQQVARLEGLTAGVRTFWQWVTIALLPAACLLAGVGVWLVRR